jgi:hypothetical protein
MAVTYRDQHLPILEIFRVLNPALCMHNHILHPDISLASELISSSSKILYSERRHVTYLLICFGSDTRKVTYVVNTGSNLNKIHKKYSSFVNMRFPVLLN